MLMIRRSYPIEAYSIIHSNMKDAGKCVILILHNLNMFSMRARVDVSFRSIEKGRYMALFLLASAMEMTKYEATEPQYHNQ